VSITAQSIQQYIGKTLYDEDGSKIGKIGAVFLDDVSGQPEWVTVSTGFFGTNESFVPVSGASARDDGLSVPHTKDKIKNAPNVDVEQGHLSTDEEANLYQYYGLDYGTSSGGRGDQGQADSRTGDEGTGYATTTGQAAGSAGGQSDVRRDDADRNDADLTQRAGTGQRTQSTQSTQSGDDRYRDEDVDRARTRTETSGTGDDAMTRSEERLNVGTETVATGKARLRKWVETERQQVEVPVRKEKVRLESEPITDENRDAALSGADITEDEHEVTVREERPVVETEAVPVERVKLATEAEEDTRTVEGEVRKERVDLDTDRDVNSRR
jgi:uncharacterized protein (TIGR02271 family)